MIPKEIFKFVPGDLVLKEKGMHTGQTGIVISVYTNSSGNTILTVLADRLIVKWYANMVSFL
jgi:ribosomal protein S4E